jgi:hypothetical protein
MLYSLSCHHETEGIHSFIHSFVHSFIHSCENIPTNIKGPLYAPQSFLVWSKSVNNKGHFTHEAETDFRPYLARYSSVVIATSHVELPAHAPHAVQVSSKSINEGHFTPYAETVSPPYLASNSSVVIETSQWHSVGMSHNNF